MMSIQSIRNSIERTRREIGTLRRKLTEESKKGADASSRIQQIKNSITKNTSASTAASKLRTIKGLEDNIVSIQKKQASINSDIARKGADLDKYEQELDKALDDERKSQERKQKAQDQERQKKIDELVRSNKDSQRRYDELVDQIRHRQSLDAANGDNVIVKAYHVFISHASEDKEEFVRPLAEKLQGRGFDVWYDEFELKIGDSLRRSIDRGLANSQFGIVVLSPSFFNKGWTEYELSGLVAKEIGGGKVILPLWHKVSKDEVLSYSPTLADKMALSTAMFTIDELVDRLADVLVIR